MKEFSIAGRFIRIFNEWKWQFLKFDAVWNIYEVVSSGSSCRIARD